MKDFMFIFRGPDYEELQMSPEQSQVAMQKWFNWIGKLSEQGIYTDGQQLINKGRVLSSATQPVTDGPFAEGKELVGGYFLIKAESLDAATDIAREFPDFDLQGTIEIREVVPPSAYES